LLSTIVYEEEIVQNSRQDLESISLFLPEANVYLTKKENVVEIIGN